MLPILLKQPLNFWRNFSFWTKAETLFLIGLLYVYAVERLLPVLQADVVNLWPICGILLHIYLFVLLSIAPFIWQYALPRQQALRVFYGKPLTSRQLIQLLGYYFMKYQTLPLLAFLPFLFAVIYLAPLKGTILLLAVLVLSGAVFVLSLKLFVLLPRKSIFFAAIYFNALLQGGIAIAVWRCLYIAFLLDILFVGVAYLLYSKSEWPPEKMNLERLYPASGKQFEQNRPGLIKLDSFPTALPQRLRALFAKEVLNLWRNPAYRRLKLYTLLFYFGGQWALYGTGRPDREMWMILSAMALIWLHYAQHFNIKYLRPDPEWLFYTEPLRFSHFWLAGFLTEFIFVLLLLAGQSMFLLVSGAGWQVQLNWLGLLFLFAFIILAVMMTFRIYFYDAPRTAGYAYHFMVIFFVVMSVNYRFVGPLMTILFLIYFTYKSYRFFNG